ncbi:MAG: SRPBCC domain-containing protein [Candidatus Dormibacteraeota bacterium]|nr:SRPBCC domain-containing protein [Candidatus Dormibacteraeota bacterium]
MDVEQQEVMTSTAVTVKAPIAVAFRVFVGLRWWPIKTHHLAEPAGDEAVLEPFLGGRWYERWADGREQDWGTVLAWEPPHRVLLRWQVSARWTYEPDPARASEIEVRFTTTGPDETLVEYSHRHLERYGEDAERMRRAVGGPGGAATSLAAYAAAMAAAE